MLIAQDHLPRDVEYWLSSSVLGARQRNTNEGSVIWINAWYESAESYCFYPERKHGKVYLEVTLDAGCRLFTVIRFGKPMDMMPQEAGRTLYRDTRAVLAYQ